MESQRMHIAGISLDIYTLNTVVVGSGAAGFNAADRLYDYGQKDIAIVTESVNTGTSRNTGSDKQTYYKLTLSGGDADSVRDMAQTLFEGQCVDGDIALCEAALSAQSFLKLVDLGVPFPRNRYGEYIGYKTDHDPRRRATSVGPYTSKVMTECLERAVGKKDVPVFDGLLAIKILVDGERAYGLLCLDIGRDIGRNVGREVCRDIGRDIDPDIGQQQEGSEQPRFVAFCCRNIVWATGGPAGMYADSAYPCGHYGASGTAFAAGAVGKNLTEWQYGLASVHPRWNVSGTYMQVLPRFISTDADGVDEREFLLDFFTDRGDLLSKVFLKGYQWPFDVRKVADGSSIIDILVYLEGRKERRVYLDFRSNPGGGELDFSLLSEEAGAYLEQAGACFGTPLERLLHMNRPAVEFYLDKGVDLAQELLEVALCAQHNNGGLGIDAWWQTNVEGLFAAGEVAASHGVYRPGGSALNAGQVGAARAAQYISACCTGQPDRNRFAELLEMAMEETAELCSAVLANEDNVDEVSRQVTSEMSSFGGAIRSRENLQTLFDQVMESQALFCSTVGIGSPERLEAVFRLKDILISQQMYLGAMLDYLENGGKSRGSAMYTDVQGQRPYSELPEEFTFILDDGARGELVQETVWNGGSMGYNWRKVRPIPEDDDFFENVWRGYRENKNIF